MNPMNSDRALEPRMTFSERLGRWVSRGILVVTVWAVTWGLYTKAFLPWRAKARLTAMRAVIVKAHADADAVLEKGGLPKTWDSRFSFALGLKQMLDWSMAAQPELAGEYERAEREAYPYYLRSLSDLDTRYAMLANEGDSCVRWKAAMAAATVSEQDVEAIRAKATPIQRIAASKAHEVFEKALVELVRIEGGRIDR